MRSNKFFDFILDFRTASVVMLSITIFLFLKISLLQENNSSGCINSTYLIFKSSYQHIIGDYDLYSFHPAEHCFTYKYSPTFAMFFGIFAILPDGLGVFLWLLIPCLTMLLAINAIPGLNNGVKSGLIYFTFFEYWVSVQSQQTNVLIAALLLIAWICLEKEQYLWATLLIVSCGFIKVFGFALLAMFLFYPRKKQLIVYTIFWSTLFLLLPMVIVPWHILQKIYQNWFHQISVDYHFTGMSVYSMFTTFTGITLPKSLILATSLIIMLGSFFQFKKWNNVRFKLLCLACLLIWVICFNHKSESSTYIIAMLGIGLWYLSRKRRFYDHILAGMVLFVLSVCFSDLVPKFVKNELGFKYHLKALPSLIIWIRIIVELWFDEFKGSSLIENKNSTSPLKKVNL